MPVIFDDTVRLVGSERTEMTAGSQPRPYVRKKVGYLPLLHYASGSCARSLWQALSEAVPYCTCTQLEAVVAARAHKQAARAAIWEVVGEERVGGDDKRQRTAGRA